MESIHSPIRRSPQEENTHTRGSTTTGSMGFSDNEEDCESANVQKDPIRAAHGYLGMARRQPAREPDDSRAARVETHPRFSDAHCGIRSTQRCRKQLDHGRTRARIHHKEKGVLPAGRRRRRDQSARKPVHSISKLTTHWAGYTKTR